MAAITWANVTAFATELTSVSASAQTDILAFVNGALDVGSFGGEESPQLKLARIYLAAHFGAVSGLGAASAGTAGSITAEEVGDVRREFGAGGSFSMGSGELGLTAYGRTFLSLVNRTGAVAMVI